MALTTSTKTLKTDKNSQQIRQKQSYIDATMSKFNEKNIFQNLSFFTIKTIGPPLRNATNEKCSKNKINVHASVSASLSS